MAPISNHRYIIFHSKENRESLETSALALTAALMEQSTMHSIRISIFLRRSSVSTVNFYLLLNVDPGVLLLEEDIANFARQQAIVFEQVGEAVLKVYREVQKLQLLAHNPRRLPNEDNLFDDQPAKKRGHYIYKWKNFGPEQASITIFTAAPFILRVFRSLRQPLA